MSPAPPHPFGHIDDETPIDDVSGLIPEIGTRRELNAHEAANVRDAVLRYFSGPVVPDGGAEFDFTWMKAVHRAMFGQVWKWAGTTRRCDLNIGVGWHRVETELLNLCLGVPWFLTTRRDAAAAPHTDIAYLHYELVRVHPFLNGNGRWARFVSNVYQIRFTDTFTDWPDELIGKAGDTSALRAEYIAAMRAADVGRPDPLAELHRRFTRPLPDL